MTTPVIEEQRGAYRVNLAVFEGPLDLLCYLIKKHDLAIRDIPIALLTEEYLRYLDTMQALNIDLAGEFLLMAAELLHCKSEMLLPVAPTGEEDEADPRADLVRRLLEYQRFKDAAERLRTRQMLHREVFRPLRPEALPEAGEAPIEGNVYHLIAAFDTVLRRMPKEAQQAIAVDRISVNQRIFELIPVIAAGRTLPLEELLPTPLTRFAVVVTFLALLEMSRLRMITVFQGGHLETIYVTGTMEEVPHGTIGVEGYS